MASCADFTEVSGAEAPIPTVNTSNTFSKVLWTWSSPEALLDTSDSDTCTVDPLCLKQEPIPMIQDTCSSHFECAETDNISSVPPDVSASNDGLYDLCLKNANVRTMVTRQMDSTKIPIVVVERLQSPKGIRNKSVQMRNIDKDLLNKHLQRTQKTGKKDQRVAGSNCIFGIASKKICVHCWETFDITSQLYDHLQQHLQQASLATSNQVPTHHQLEPKNKSQKVVHIDNKSNSAASTFVNNIGDNRPFPTDEGKVKVIEPSSEDRKVIDSLLQEAAAKIVYSIPRFIKTVATSR